MLVYPFLYPLERVSYRLSFQAVRLINCEDTHTYARLYIAHIRILVPLWCPKSIVTPTLVSSFNIITVIFDSLSIIYNIIYCLVARVQKQAPSRYSAKKSAL